MMADTPFTPIRREKGGVTARDVQGSKIIYAARLSDAPTDDWKRFLREGLYGEYPVVCDPKDVLFGPRELLFETEEQYATLWVQSIDQWIDDTNRRYHDHLLSELRRAEEHRDRLQHATDIVKDL